MEIGIKMTSNLTNGYLASPKESNGKKILVLHAWWGLSETVKNYCDQFADAGFVAYAPDLYHGKLTDEIEQAEVFSYELSLDQARLDLEEALEFVQNQPPEKVNKVGLIGFSLGAYLALDASVLFPEIIDKVVIVYGDGPDDYENAKASYLAHFAENDPYEPESNREELENAFKKSNCPYTFYTYPNTGHWFCEPDRTGAYNEEAAKFVWERTLSFLTQP
jgi:carboxymethylenebutenolidase